MSEMNYSDSEFPFTWFVEEVVEGYNGDDETLSLPVLGCAGTDEVLPADAVPADVNTSSLPSGSASAPPISSTQSSSSTAVSISPHPRPRRGRKQILNQSRAERKANRNANKSYLTEKGVEKDERDFRFYICSCSLKCDEKVPEDVRREVWQKFWANGNYATQMGFIAANVEEIFPKRKRVSNSSRRQYTRIYYIGDIQVCREVFRHTLRVSTYRINTALKKLKHSSKIQDQRGAFSGGHNVLLPSTVKRVKAHINRFPRYISHYTREKSKKEYLNPELTLHLMYTLFLEKYPTIKISQSSYVKIFVTNFNLRRKRWQKDTCNKCDLFMVQQRNAVGKEERLKAIKAEHDTHLLEADGTRELMKNDFVAATLDPDLEVLSFDLEKTLPIPRIPSNLVYYKRQLSFYNLGIRSAKENKGYCYTWVETEASRGAQEVGSCLRKHILSHDNKKKLILWSDSCGGQNQNIKLVLLLKGVLEECTVLESISIRFLISGHSMMKNDSDFGDIECKLKGVSRLYTADDYRHVIRTCRTKYPLVEVTMRSDDFVSTALLEKAIVNRKKAVCGHSINWLLTREITFEKDKRFQLVMFQEFGGEGSILDIERKRAGRPPSRPDFLSSLFQPLWPEGKPLKPNKKKDLLSLQAFIPNDALPFYTEKVFNAIENANILDDVDGFNVEELDFEVEEYYLDLDESDPGCHGKLDDD